MSQAMKRKHATMGMAINGPNEPTAQTAKWYTPSMTTANMASFASRLQFTSQLFAPCGNSLFDIELGGIPR